MKEIYERKLKTIKPYMHTVIQTTYDQSGRKNEHVAIFSFRRGSPIEPVPAPRTKRAEPNTEILKQNGSSPSRALASEFPALGYSVCGH
jgi:hypothetical protein